MKKKEKFCRKQYTKEKIDNDRKTKVAIVSQSMNVGGGEMMAARLASYIDSNKFDVKFFIISKKQNNQIKTILDESGISYECLGLPTSFNMKSYRVFSDAMKKFAPDVVHEHLDVCYSWIWCILHNCPLIATMHSDPYRRKSLRVATVMKLKAAQRNLKIIGCSQLIAQLIKKCYRIPDKYVRVIYNPIDTSEYIVSKHSCDVIKFVHIGRFHNVKNHNMLINAFYKSFHGVEKVKLYLAGDGPLLHDIQDKVKKMGMDGQIIFLGNVKNISALLAGMDVLVLSSISEACPLAILEGMAAGLPIVSTRVGGVPELVTNNGILVDNRDEENFSRALCLLAKDRQKLHEFAEHSIQNVKRFDKSIISDMYEEEYFIMGKK